MLDDVLSAVEDIRDVAWWKLLPDDVLTAGRKLEQLSRLVYAAQIHLAGELDDRDMAASRSCPSTATLLRQTFNISAGDATGRVRAAAQTLPREMVTGPDAPPLLPLLAEAVNAGQLGAQHIRTVVETMKKVPASVRAEVRDACEHALVTTAIDCDPGYLERAAALILERADPDGKLDKDDAAARMGLDFGSRNIRTGLTPLKGQLDDLGVEAVRKAIDALSAPQPAADGVADTRSPSNRRAHALVAAMRGFLDAGCGPSQGGQRPHLTVTLSWDVLTGMISAGRFDTGGYVSPATARQLLCDAVLVPAILGSASEVLDVGRSSRTFPPAIRRAIAVRDGGCAWPGCDRPPNWCDGHHIEWWCRDFGTTSLDNGVLLCPFHHSEIHKGQWRITMNTGGLPEFIPPLWIDPTQRPRQNTLHHFAGPVTRQ